MNPPDYSNTMMSNFQAPYPVVMQAPSLVQSPPIIRAPWTNYYLEPIVSNSDQSNNNYTIEKDPSVMPVLTYLQSAYSNPYQLNNSIIEKDLPVTPLFTYIQPTYSNSYPSNSYAAQPEIYSVQPTYPSFPTVNPYPTQQDQSKSLMYEPVPQQPPPPYTAVDQLQLQPQMNSQSDATSISNVICE